MHLIKRLAFFKHDPSSRKSEYDQGKLLRKIGRQGRKKGQLDHPTGIAITKSGDIVVADSDNHRIQIFSSDGAFKAKFGEKGTEPHQLSYPRGLAITPDEFIAVTDFDNAAVKIFTSNGKLDRHFTHEDRMPLPHGLAVTSDGYFVVTDVLKHCVLVLNPFGDVSHVFGTYGDGSQELDHPYHVVTNSNKQIIVSDSGNSAIKIFHFQGKLLRCFRQDDFRLPPELSSSIYLTGLAVDSDDNTIVASSDNIYILTKNGRLWEILTESDGLAFPRNLACSSGRLYATQGGPTVHNICIFRYNKEDYSEGLRKMEEEDSRAEKEGEALDGKKKEEEEGGGAEGIAVKKEKDQEKEEGKLEQAEGGTDLAE